MNVTTRHTILVYMRLCLVNTRNRMDTQREVVDITGVAKFVIVQRAIIMSPLQVPRQSVSVKNVQQELTRWLERMYCRRVLVVQVDMATTSQDKLLVRRVLKVSGQFFKI